MEHHKLCSTRAENDIGDGYEGICDCAEIYQHEAKELESELRSYKAYFVLMEAQIKELEAEIEVLKMTLEHYKTGGNVKF